MEAVRSEASGLRDHGIGGLELLPRGDLGGFCLLQLVLGRVPLGLGRRCHRAVALVFLPRDSPGVVEPLRARDQGARVLELGVDHRQLFLHLNDPVLGDDEVGLHLGAARPGGGQPRLRFSNPRGQLHTVEPGHHLPGPDRIPGIDGHVHDSPGHPRVHVLLVERRDASRVDDGTGDGSPLHRGDAHRKRRVAGRHPHAHVHRRAVRPQICTERPRAGRDHDDQHRELQGVHGNGSSLLRRSRRTAAPTRRARSSV